MATIPDPVEHPTLTVDEAAAVLKLSRNSAYEAIRTGVIPSIRVGRRLLVPTAKLVELLGLPQVDPRCYGDPKAAPPDPPGEPSPASRS